MSGDFMWWEQSLEGKGEALTTKVLNVPTVFECQVGITSGEQESGIPNRIAATVF